MLRVKKVEYLEDYKLKIYFSNRKIKIFDFKKWVFEENIYFKPLRDVEFFKKVQIDDFGYSICWPNGADFSPDTLYQEGDEIPGKNRKNRLRARKRRHRSVPYSISAPRKRA